MSRLLTYVGSIVLLGHGMIHLLGTAVYLGLADVAEFPYKTTLLGGAVNVGDVGMRVFGVLWAVAAIGFVAAAGAVLVDWDHWPLVVGAVAIFSLGLTTLDYTVAYAGIVVNLGILVAVVYSYFI
ncbi:ABC transporter permease [Natronococcus pandeyae]|uniref:ABC transporter permease n=1 Tax=Natronococcus pandeyae TaxID=2055836 RepID=A0A8J8Q793_9EURY|nr:ABC transporter permease [Natronococcus pandeyae]TYL39958.1 ABC transporter permease [Natronococcus pandeyae]